MHQVDIYVVRYTKAVGILFINYLFYEPLYIHEGKL